MESKRFRIGSIAVLFAIVVFCVAIFSTLTVVTAKADYRAAQRSGEHVRALYDCENLGQQWLAQVGNYLEGSAPLPQGSRQEGSEIFTEITSCGMTLEIRLEITDKTYTITRWNCTANWQPEDGWQLFQ